MNISSMKFYFLVGLIVGVVIAAAKDDDPEPELDPVKYEYCPMWEIWHDQKAAGIPIEQRNGWPDQAGRYFEECEQ